MKLRLHRTFQWVIDVPARALPLGARDLPYTLKATDTLQFQDEKTGEWHPLEVVEAPRPPHPREAQIAELSSAVQSELAQLIARATAPR